MNSHEIRAITQKEIKKALWLLKVELDHMIDDSNSLDAQIAMLATSVAVNKALNKIGE